MASEYALAAAVLRQWGVSRWAAALAEALPPAGAVASPVGRAWIAEASGDDRAAGSARRDLDAVGPAPYPHALLEARYLQARLGGFSGGAPPPPLEPRGLRSGTIAEVYELVHAVLYLTDFGDGRWYAGRSLLSGRSLAIGAALRRAGTRALRARRLDLMGEIALAAMCLERSGKGASVGGLAELMEPVRTAAAIAGGRLTPRAGPVGAYHSALVALLALSLFTSRRPHPRPGR